MKNKNDCGKVLNRNNLISNEPFNVSGIQNKASWLQYHNKLCEMALASIEWQGLPSEIDAAFLERTLFFQGAILFYKDEELGQFIALPFTSDGQPDIYNVPIKRRAYASNGYNYPNLTNENSVIIYNNLIRTPSTLDMEIYSKRLADLDRIMDVNLNAQKTPVLIVCDETQRLTMKNLYMQYDGNQPFIFGEKSQINPNSIKCLQTGAPYLLDKLWDAKTKLWNEALTYIGIANISAQKKERMISDEVARGQGGVIASRYSRIEARRQAVKKINEIFNLDIQVYFRGEIMEKNSADSAESAEDFEILEEIQDE